MAKGWAEHDYERMVEEEIKKECQKKKKEDNKK